MNRNARFTPTLAVAITALFLLAPSASAITPRFAAPTPSGTMDCSSVANACSLRFAITDMSANNGDDVVVLPGTHDIGSTEINIAKALNVHGQAGSAIPVITSTSPQGMIRVNNDAATLSFVDIENGNANNGAQAGLMVTAGTADRVISHTLIAGNQACLVSGNTSAPHATLRDSLCFSEGSGGVGLGLSCMCSSFVGVLQNVTAIGETHGIRLASALGGQTFTLNATNVIAQGASGYDVVTGGQAAGEAGVVNLDHSAYDTATALTGGSSVTTPGTGTNVVTTPAQMFVNPANDFRQLSTSPTVNAGTAFAGIPALDLDGNARTQGSAPDIGAYEFATPPPNGGGGGGGGQTQTPLKKKKCKRKKAKKCKKEKKR